MKKNISFLFLTLLLAACDEKNDTQVVSEIEPNVVVQEQQTITQEQPASVPEDIETQVVSTQIYPKELIQYIQVRQNHCAKSDKQKIDDLVKLVNLSGDEKPEFLLEPDSINCKNDASLNGNSGRQILLFSTLEDGKTKLVFDHPMFDYEIKQGDNKQELWLDVGGGFCGQDMSQISRSEAITCKRLIEWDEKAHEFKLGKMVVENQ